MNVGRSLLAISRMSRTRYPAFIFGWPLGRKDIPVFTYHDVEPAEFSRDLEFLRSNGYRALSLDEYMSVRATGGGGGRRVLLTFDDARKSFWEVALPLLRTFDTRAVLFAPSYWMTPALRRVPSGGPNDDLFMSWEQLRACLDSGLVDVESHAHRHALVPISSRLVDFAHPQALARFDIYDWPMRCIDGAEELGRPAPGTPVYRAAPLLSATHRYLENGELTRACRDFVERSGGADYFLRPGWRAALQAFHRDGLRRMAGRLMDAVEIEGQVAAELELSRESFRKQLGYAPAYIAYPWMLGSHLSLRLAQRIGFRAAFGVALDYGAERNRDRLPIPVFGRLKSDWLRFLPGKSRCSVLAAVGKKVAGFGKIQHLAH